MACPQEANGHDPLNHIDELNVTAVHHDRGSNLIENLLHLIANVFCHPLTSLLKKTVSLIASLLGSASIPAFSGRLACS